MHTINEKDVTRCGGRGLAQLRYQTPLGSLDAEIAVTTDPVVLADLETQHDYTTAFLGRYYGMKYHYDSAAALFAYYLMYRAALPFYMMEGDYVDAQTMHNNLPLVTHDDSLYAYETQLAINLYSAGNTWEQLDSVNADSLLGLVQYNTAAGYMAGGVSTLLGTGYVTWPIPVFDSAIYDTVMKDATADRVADNAAPISNINTTTNSLFSFYPNPNFGSITLVATNSGTFRIHTIEGKLLREYTINAGKTELQLPANLATGLYLGTYTPDNGGKPIVIRFVYQQ